jgi:hypothetical protein
MILFRSIFAYQFVTEPGSTVLVDLIDGDEWINCQNAFKRIGSPTRQLRTALNLVVALTQIAFRNAQEPNTVTFPKKVFANC